MSYITISAVSASSPAVVLQTALKALGKLQAKDVDGVVGKGTMTAVLKAGWDALEDFTKSINATGEFDARKIASGAALGVRNKLNEAQDGVSKFNGNFTALQAAQTKLKTQWITWIKAGGSGLTDRAAAFTSMTLVKPGTGGTGGTGGRQTTPGILDIGPVEPVAPVGFDLRSKLPLIAGGVVGVGVLLFLMSRKKRK